MLLKFRSWVERFSAANGTLPKRLRYTRKSTEAAERQAASHDQQMEAADTKWGAIDHVWWWKDSCSGTTFDRPAYQDMLAFCRANRRPKTDLGCIELNDPSRFARVLDEENEPDLIQFQNAFNEFESLGWPLHFVSRERTGNVLLDIMMLAMEAYASAAFSQKLSRDVRRGRRDYTRAGWWTNGGAPWGTRRYDTVRKRVLQKGEPSSGNGGSTILVADPPVLELWNRAARMILSGKSLDSVGREFNAESIAGPRGGDLQHSAIKNFLTNRALIGRVEYLDDGKANRARTEVKANWEPLVDPATFQLVSRTLAERTAATGGRTRRHREQYPLTPVCAHCGIEYNGGRTKESQGSERQYAHGNPKERASSEDHARRNAAGCKIWYVSAAELEEKIKDLIVEQRGTDEFRQEVSALINDRLEAKKHSAHALEDAKTQLLNAERVSQQLALFISKLAGNGQEVSQDEALLNQMRNAAARVDAARRAVADAESFAVSRDDVLSQLHAVIDETRNIGDLWESSSLEERSMILDYWVLDVLIVVRPVANMPRANHKAALVTLRTAPKAPYLLSLGEDLTKIDSAAADSSARAAESVSDNSAVSIAGNAADVAIRPSAQAACPRTNGSSSESAEISDGTSSADPTLPSTTAALRFSPRSFARFIGDPLNAAEYSERESDSNHSAIDRASFPSSDLRDANARSVTGVENLPFHGHTS